MQHKDKKVIELALQGGGSHGAVTWGVLDRLLEESDIHIEGISGTSAGAMNAVVMADGLADNDRDYARERLHNFWHAISETAQHSPLQRSFWDRWTGNWSMDSSPAYLFMDFLTRTFSPYELNPMSLNPLRNIVEQHIDFARVNACKTVKIFVTATNVRTGKPHIFRQPNICADRLMASAALPMMFQAVEIDGESYWDGGYAGNPALFPLVDDCNARDLVLVQLNPFYRDKVPQTAREIVNRLNEITFNNSLLKELRSILLLKQIIESEDLEHERYRQMRLHRIHSDEDLAHLSPSSKMNAEWKYLTYLRDLGRAQTDQWLVQNRDHIGQHSTFDVSWILEDSIRPAELKKETAKKKASEAS
ncbi:MAG: patatin-like phospholipase family protein [Alphaproteobacteria bacterium]